MDEPKESRKDSQATRMVQLVFETESELWHTQDEDPFVSFWVDDHVENLPLTNSRASRLLRRLYFDAYRTAASSQALNDAIGTLQAKAVFEGSTHEAHVRVAECEGNVYLDLGDKSWRAIEVTLDGWGVLPAPPVKFWRPYGLQKLPEPVHDGSMRHLRCFVNVKTDSDFLLMVTWLIAAIYPQGPYPVLTLSGEQGSAKSTVARILRRLIDPNAADLRSEPRNEHDLAIAARNSRVICLDNLSHVPQWLSDGLCRLATGGGFAARSLYTNADETIFDNMSPILLTGIPELATRGDLADRAIALELPPLPDESRMTEAELWAKFRELQPQMLGAVLDVLSVALRELPNVELVGAPRMADFARLGAAVAQVLGWEVNEFLLAYEGKREAAGAAVLDGSLVAQQLIDFMVGRPSWCGTWIQLLDNLSRQAGDSVVKQNKWPRQPNGLSRRVRVIAPELRRVGLSVDTDSKPPGKRRGLTIKNLKLARTSSKPSESSEAGAISLSNDSDAVRSRDGRGRFPDGRDVPTATRIDPLRDDTDDKDDRSRNTDVDEVEFELWI